MTTTTEKPPVKFDRYRRYLLPDPETGEERPWTRATTLAGTLADRYGLEQWAQRNTVYGLGQRQDLYALAAACTPDDKTQLGQIVDQAQEAAKARSGANLGTALHRLTERIDTGADLDVPDQWKPDIDAYCQALVDAQITIWPDMIERIVVAPQYEAAGTLDRLVTVAGDNEYIVADLKTGKDVVRYGMTEIALQLAIYANATHMWNGDSYEPMPPVNTDRALVIHLPVGTGECHLHQVDIRAGAEAVALAHQVRAWRKRKDLSTPHKTTNQRRPDLQIVDNDDW